MCGIAAIITKGARSTDGTLAGALESMLLRISHRGDAENFGESRIADRWAAGTNRLAITDREHGVQPIARDGLTLFYNGELFNTDLLRNELVELGFDFETGTDTEVVLTAYVAWGKEALTRLSGMYALVIFSDDDDSFVVARDPFGIKPLYISENDESVLIASELKSFNDIESHKPVEFEPGHWYDGSTYQRFSTVLDVSPDPGQYRIDEGALIHRYRDLFHAAVRSHVDTDLPVAVTFSGGIDSAAVLAAARRYHDNVVAFTVGFKGSADIAVARRYCEEQGIAHHVEEISLSDVIAAIPTVVQYGEFFEAIDAMDSCISYFAYRLIQRHGFKVAVCGEGSDELLGGYDLFRIHPDPIELVRYRTRNLRRTDIQRVDRMSMVHSVETRVPFLDLDLATFTLGLPFSVKMRNGVEKWILRQAVADLLPDYIVHRPKIRMPDGSGLKSQLREYAAEMAAQIELPGGVDVRLGLTAPEERYFLAEYLEQGYPVPVQRHKLAGYDYDETGYFTFVS
ncbi:asparagine synthase (glutamine-hydrolyzing) [Nocardia sp. NPDC051321]|uniref:asparagine synthase (glutamine-hydrolyzing) n=1 Tax=Nocardia sp. NPDC051321 TaxID=3364323 RepID=UPI0037BCF840